MQTNPITFRVSATGSVSGSTGGKAWRKQEVLCVQGEEVRKISYFLRDGEPYLEPGNYALAPDAVYVGDIAYTDRQGKARSEPGLRVSPRFVKLAPTASK